MRKRLSRPAVIIGSSINGLGVARSLALNKVPIVLVDNNLKDPAMHTRYGVKHVFRSLEGKTLILELDRLRKQFEEDPVLFLTQEKSVETVAMYSDVVTSQYRISLPSAAVIKSLQHKASFQTMAEEGGFPVPRTVFLKKEQDLSRVEALSFPCVLKPGMRDHGYGARFSKAYKVHTMVELVSLFRKIAAVLPDLVVQEWVEGGDDCIYFCLQFRSPQGPVASFTGRKLRCWPPGVGGTATCISAPEHASELEQITNDFFSTVEFFGIGSMEYKRDSRTGRFLMIEPTVGRTDFQEEVATLNGVNIPFAAYEYECGFSASKPRIARFPFIWSETRLDRWARESRPANCPVAFPTHARKYDALWRLNDPAPWVVSMLDRTNQWVALMRKRISLSAANGENN
jgi:D-aspartate ligase